MRNPDRCINKKMKNEISGIFLAFSGGKCTQRAFQCCNYHILFF